jgi:pyruvate formate lyase activating enzyme
MTLLSLKSGGCIKFDIKAWDERMHHALCGVSNKKTLENFRWLSRFISQRPDPPFLVASTLLVPGYVDAAEVSKIAGFISDLDPEIPYRLLAFHPEFMLSDLPTTSRTHALRCREAARQAGLRRISVGNVHLLADSYW